MKKFLLLSMLAIAIFATSISDVMAQVPKKMNYQASLLDKDGKPLSGNPSITFKIYDAETGGTELWNEVQNVTPVMGFINVELGAVTPIELPFDQQYWLEITVANGTPFPKTPLLTTPYSFRAMTADSAKVAAMSYTANEAKVALDLSPALKKVTGGDVTGTYPVLNFDDSKLLDKLKNGKITQDMLNPNITFPPSGPAYGDLTGFYPGPAIAAGAVTNVKLANDAVTTQKILNGTILNEDIADPNYTITSNGSITVPGPLVLGQDFALTLNMANSNTWTAKQHFNGGLTLFGHDFDNPTTAGQVYVFDGTNWVATGANGDVTGLFNGLRVEKLWNVPLNGPATATNQLYIYDGTNWTPGLIMNANVAANAAIAVTKLAAGSANQFLVNDGTTNKWASFAKSTNFVGNGVTSSLELSTTGVAAGTYGSSYQAPVFSVDAFGRLSFAGNTVITAVGATTSDVTVVNGAINDLDLQLKVGSVGSPEILDGSIQNIDMADPNFTITSNGSITVPGALVLGQDFALTLNMANSNTWTATQNFNAGLTGSTGTFSGIVSALQFNGALQYSLNTGDALQTASFNNSGNTTLNVLYDNSTIAVNGANRLYVPTGGITTTQILDGTILAADLADNSVTEPKLNMANLPQDKYVIKWNNGTGNMEWADASVYVVAPITGNGTQASPLGLAYLNTQLGLNGSNQLYIINGGITSAEIANGTIVDADIANLTITNGKLVNSSITLNGGNGLTNGGVVSLGGSLTFDVNVDNSTIEINADALRVKDNGITEPKLNMFNLPSDKYVIKWDAVNGMTWADASVYVQAPITGNGTQANPLGLAYDATLKLTSGQLGLDLAHSNTWTAVQNFNGGLTGTTATLTGALNGTTGTFSGAVTASVFNGATQYGVTAGYGLLGGTFNNTSAKVFTVDEATDFNWTGDQTWAGTATFNGMFTANSNSEFNNFAQFNSDLAIANTGSFISQANLNLFMSANVELVDGIDLIAGSGLFNHPSAASDVYVTGNLEVDGLAYLTLGGKLTQGNGVVAFMYDGSANATVAVNYDNSTIGVNGTNQIYVKAEGITNVEIKDGTVRTNEILDETILATDIATGAVTTSEILDGTVQNIDMADPNFTITSNGSITVPGALVLGQDFALTLNMANTNTWTAVQNFNGGLTGTTATLTGLLTGTTANFSGTVTANQFNGNLQYGVTAGVAMSGGTFNNSANRTFDVRYDNSTIGVNGSNNLYVPTGGIKSNEILDETILANDIATGAVTTSEILDETILANDIATGAVTTSEILDGTILNIDIADPNYTVTSTGGSMIAPGALVLGQDFNLDFNLAHSNTWTAIQHFNAGLDGTTATLSGLIEGGSLIIHGDSFFGDDNTSLMSVQSQAQFNDVLSISNTGQFISQANLNYFMSANVEIFDSYDLILGSGVFNNNSGASDLYATGNGEFDGNVYVAGFVTAQGNVITAGTFNGNLQRTLSAGQGLTTGASFNNSANVTFNVLYDNSTIGLNGTNQLYVKAEGITNVEIKDGTVRTNEIMDGTILNIDIADPNYNVTSTDASMIAPGALVLGQDFNLQINTAHSNTWTALQTFNAGLNGTFGTFSGNVTTTAGTFNGNLQFGVTGGVALTGGTFNNGANKTFDVRFDNSTIGVNGSNNLYVPTGGITTTQILDGTIQNIDIADPNYTITSADGSMIAPGARVLGQDYDLQINTAHSNTWTALQTFNAGLNGTFGTFSGNVTTTAGTFNGNLQYTLTAGQGLTTGGTFNNSASTTFNVLYDNTTIGLNGSNQLYIKDNAITEPKLAMNNLPADKYVIKWNAGGGYMEWTDASVYTNATLTGDGTLANPLGINLAHANDWTAKQTFTSTTANAAVEVVNQTDGLAFTVSRGKASFTGGETQVNYADNTGGSVNPLFIVQQTGTDGGAVLITNSGQGAPALEIYQTNAAQPAVKINNGSVVMSNTSYAANGALDLSYTMHAITAGNTFTAAAGTNGQFIYVVNTTGGALTVNGINVAAGTAATFVYYGAWYKAN